MPDLDTHRSYETPDGTGPWTLVALCKMHRPGARAGRRGTYSYVEMHDARLNRRFVYETQDKASEAAAWWNRRLEAAQEGQVIDTDRSRVHHKVDKYDVALRDDAAPTTPQN